MVSDREEWDISVHLRPGASQRSVAERLLLDVITPWVESQGFGVVGGPSAVRDDEAQRGWILRFGLCAMPPHTTVPASKCAELLERLAAWATANDCRVEGEFAGCDGRSLSDRLRRRLREGDVEAPHATLSHSFSAYRPGCFEGRLAVGELVVTFAASAAVWSRDDYLASWRAALTRALSGEDAVLIVDWTPDADAPASDAPAAEVYWIYCLGPDRYALQNAYPTRRTLERLGSLGAGCFNPPPRVAPAHDPALGAEVPLEWSASRGEFAALLASLDIDG